MAEWRQILWDDACAADAAALFRLALVEDLRDRGDLTTQTLVPATQPAVAAVVARSSGTVAGLAAIDTLLALGGDSLRHEPRLRDGQEVRAGETLTVLSGSASAILTIERTLLNLLCRLSGIATTTRQYVRALEALPARLYDTRKTTPGQRLLEKYAVRCGGGTNHRSGLHDGYLIKDNHLAAWAAEGGSISEAIAAAHADRERRGLAAGDGVLIEIEVDSLDQLRAALPAGAEVVLLDNFSLSELREAVQLRDAVARGVQLEASGNVRLERVALIAATGVDRISAGALTHSASHLDLGLDWDLPKNGLRDGPRSG